MKRTNFASYLLGVEKVVLESSKVFGLKRP